MTRREREILIASVSWTDKTLTVNEEKAFQAGARWADKTMIDKACEWLKENIWDNFILSRIIPIKRLPRINYKPRKTTYKTVKRFSAKRNR